MVTPSHRRAAVSYLQAAYGVSERRACRVTGTSRATHRYRSVADPQDELRLRVRELAATRVRYGYRRIHVLLRREGWPVNHKRVYRLYRDDGLAIRAKTPRRRRAPQYRATRPELAAPNQAWAMDVPQTIRLRQRIRVPFACLRRDGRRPRGPPALHPRRSQGQKRGPGLELVASRRSGRARHDLLRIHVHDAVTDLHREAVEAAGWIGVRGSHHAGQVVQEGVTTVAEPARAVAGARCRDGTTHHIQDGESPPAHEEPGEHRRRDERRGMPGVRRRRQMA